LAQIGGFAKFFLFTRHEMVELVTRAFLLYQQTGLVDPRPRLI